MMRVASSSMRGRMALAAFGMNSAATILRSAVWRGGSTVSIIWWSPRSIPSTSGIRTVGLDENVAGSRPTALTSSYRVTAQKPVGTRLGVPVHRVVRPQPGELVVRLAVREGSRRQQIDVDHGTEPAARAVRGATPRGQ